ncbi:MATE family efflux transporter [Clostridium botulinum]|uniref:Probable multidrug resistance protein NorM n=2 Tax=Clostridium botulinum TaxID=1491 RepID=A0A846I539_CLOBO|nr:MATE family efflux transporter [Clostridium botulinum]AJD27641.1 MATE efflux family protein [Clostridium botulinum CDC_297]ACQ55107.1 MATE efflux family protein [Clostridium botulinum Ba4 str. 657]AJE10101.1 MATE efflux family protein [Clostridium botulinum CDC_1436]APQ99332.1 MATE efflux family protein [Clostridium botulinum]APU59211.1 MATE efflux family protein [Clostridium botulinum]
METDMTKGKPMGIIVRFFIPMFIGNLFQQIYNVVDSIVVGRFVGNEAFAAVGSCFLIMSFMTSILIGLAMGASAFFSQLYGAKQYDEMKKAISTSFFFILSISILLSIITNVFLYEIIELFQMPKDTVTYSAEYLRYILTGLIFTGLYNICAYLLRSIGDSKSPLYFLIVSCILNTILDLIFVLVFNMGVSGVGLATFIAQGVSALWCAFYTVKHMKFLDFKRKDIVFSRKLFKTILSYSVLTAVQQSLSSFGMLMIQGLINTFGTTVMAAFAACSKIDEFANRPLQDLSNAFSTYVAQNKGAGNIKRIRQGFHAILKVIALISFIISIVVFIFAPNLISIFVKKESIDIIQVGVGYLRIVCIFYILLGCIVMFYGFFRGMGEVNISIILTVVSQGIRVALAYGLARTSMGFTGICWSIVIGWFLSNALGGFMYKKVMANSI